MSEYEVPNKFPSTYEFHKERERAKHLEDPVHRGRILKAVEFIRSVGPASVSDLGCGDGGLLSLIKDIPSWGYDFTPSMREGWIERGIKGYRLDVFNDRRFIMFGELVVMTEVLEHLANPHDTLHWISQNCKYIVCSSPWGETLDSGMDGYEHDCHVWAWDEEGYMTMIREHFYILKYEKVSWSQVVLAQSKHYG